VKLHDQLVFAPHAVTLFGAATTASDRESKN
jgi:hypothetical protein